MALEKPEFKADCQQTLKKKIDECVSQYTQPLEDCSMSLQIELSNPISKEPVEQSMHN